MRKQYELWLDESGTFEDEKKAKLTNRKPSLIGGFLLEKKIAETIDFDGLIDASRNHAMDLTNEDKKEYILPVLERMEKEYSARQVFFENAEYEEEDSNRQLYLRVMAEGLLQLMQTLNAEHESVVLEVLIARRQDMSAPVPRRRIQEQEYIRALEKCIEHKKKERKIRLNKYSQLKFEVRPAHTSQKIQLADFACNTRLTRDSAAFADVKNRVAALYLNAYLFSLSEIGSENYVKRCLAQGYFSDAIMELYTTLDRMDRKKYLNIIVKRMENTAYRLVKAQMKKLEAELVSYLAKEDDYEIGERILKRMEAELIPCLKVSGLPYLKLHFCLLLQMADMFLREGDLQSARRVLVNCRTVQKELGDSLEEVFSYYQLQEKEALLEINEFDFESGCKRMREVCSGFQTLMRAIEQDAFLGKRFVNIRSEYYGDALCMLLYAEMFLQRTYSERYAELCAFSDLAMKQYPKAEGELERHRQYRSRIEAEQGNYERALAWLILAKMEHVEILASDGPIQKAQILEFLNRVCNTEPVISCQYYLMYYVLIMTEAVYRDNVLADVMYQALAEQERLLKICGVRTEVVNLEYHEVNIRSVHREVTGISYHPVEVVFWKLASYYMQKGKYETALAHYRKATAICSKAENYSQMRIVGFGIEAERILCLYRAGKKQDAVKAAANLNLSIKEMMKLPLRKSTRDFVCRMEKFVTESQLSSQNPDPEKLWEAARMITY